MDVTISNVFTGKGTFGVKPKLCTALACTWSRSNIYLAGEERIIDIRNCVQELVDHFIKAYVSVNLKQ
jgi:hypothetical protein